MIEKIEQGIRTVVVHKHNHDNHIDIINDCVGTEMPLQIRIKGKSQSTFTNLAVLMCTPGNEKELVVGFLYYDGLIKEASDIINISSIENNIIHITTKNLINNELKEKTRNTISTSSCGICSTPSLDSITKESQYLSWTSKLKIKASLVYKLVEEANKNNSELFNCTGSVHSSTLFNYDGTWIMQYEDVGRHNALDKLIGKSLKKKLLPLSKHVLLLSGRISFELVQKASLAGIPIIIARGAPTSLAIEEAFAQNICLVGFVKEDSFNIYTTKERIIR